MPEPTVCEDLVGELVDGDDHGAVGKERGAQEIHLIFSGI